MFHHNSLQKLNLQRIDSPTGRKYVTPEGNAYTSVTTFLGSQGKEELDRWREAVGIEEARKISSRAATRGTKMHDRLEAFLCNEEVVIPSNDLVGKSLFTPFSKHLQETVSNIRGIELPLYSDSMELAGTMDLLAEYSDVLSIIDFKSANRIKDKHEIENYFLQCSLYSIMIEERYGLKVPQIVILIGVEFSDRIQVFVEQRKNYFPKLVLMLKERNRG